MSDCTASFFDRLVRWQRVSGRHGLPWQGSADPYRVWLSEIMLQQTQVATVLHYFPRFVDRFPDVASLAAAPLDEVLALWSGLGYYSRARNLHRCAIEVVERWSGCFPASAAQLQTLPGIGRSTAAAISAFCHGERVSILDGNVRRVLARYLGYAEDLVLARHVESLWERADRLVSPEASPTEMAAYTQGLMDLGAMVCTVRQPACAQCPVADDCVARRDGAVHQLPLRSRRIRRSSESLWLLALVGADGSVWLERRPDSGIWAGLYCLPVFSSRDDLLARLPSGAATERQEAPVCKHALTHKDLYLHPVWVRAQPTSGPGDGAWHPPASWSLLGLPTPIRRLLMSPA